MDLMVGISVVIRKIVKFIFMNKCGKHRFFVRNTYKLFHKYQYENIEKILFSYLTFYFWHVIYVFI